MSEDVISAMGGWSELKLTSYFAFFKFNQLINIEVITLCIHSQIEHMDIIVLIWEKCVCLSFYLYRNPL